MAFDGEVAGYLGTRLAALLITVLTLGFGFPYALVLVKRWDAQHLLLGGQRLVFTGRADDLMAYWVRWWPVVVLTVGIYGFAVLPRVTRWVWDNTDYVALWRVGPPREPAYVRPLAAPVRIHLAFFTDPGAHRAQP